MSLDPVLSSFAGNKWVECRCGVHPAVKLTDKRYEGEREGLPELRFILLCGRARRLTMCGHESLLALEH